MLKDLCASSCPPVPVPAYAVRVSLLPERPSAQSAGRRNTVEGKTPTQHPLPHRRISASSWQWLQNDSRKNVRRLLQMVSNLISSGCRFPCSAQPAVTIPQAHSSTSTGLPQQHHIWGIISLAFLSLGDFQMFRKPR